VGTPGGSLTPSASFVANPQVAAMGRRGEEATARVLDPWWSRPGGVAVFHDVSIPGSPANIDHVVVAGNRVWLIDSKCWKPAFYIRVGARAYRGWRRFRPAEKHVLDMAHDRLREHFARQGVAARFAPSTVVVWPSHDDAPLRVWALRRMPGARVVGPTRFAALARRRCREAGDPQVCSVLTPLVKGPR